LESISGRKLAPEVRHASFIGHTKDSLWSLDLFRCESAMLRTYWVLVVMDQFTRRIVGFAVHRGVADGAALCRMFSRAIFRTGAIVAQHRPSLIFRVFQQTAESQC
jgi:transposase InsO family protein